MELAVLDNDRVRMVAELGGTEFLRHLAAVFSEQAREKMGEIRAAVQAGNLEAVRLEAHKIHGSALNIGALRVAHVAGQLEAVTTAPEELGPLAEALHTEVESASAQLAAFEP